MKDVRWAVRKIGANRIEIQAVCKDIPIGKSFDVNIESAMQLSLALRRECAKADPEKVVLAEATWQQLEAQKLAAKELAQAKIEERRARKKEKKEYQQPRASSWFTGPE